MGTDETRMGGNCIKDEKVLRELREGTRIKSESEECSSGEWVNCTTIAEKHGFGVEF